MVLGADSREPWSREDVTLMTAYQILEGEKCSQCGLPSWQCQSEDRELMVRIKEHTCFVKAELDKRHEAKDHKTPPGVTLYPELYRRDDKPLHKMRSEYYKGLAEARKSEGDAK